MNWRLTLRGLLRPKLARRDDYPDRWIIRQQQQQMHTEPTICGMVCLALCWAACIVAGSFIAWQIAPTLAALLGIPYDLG